MGPPCPLRRRTFSQVADTYIRTPASWNFFGFWLFMEATKRPNFGDIRIVSRGLVKRLAASVNHRTLYNTAQSAAMTSRPLPSNTRLNTAPILPVLLPTMEPEKGSFAVRLTRGTAYLFRGVSG